MADRCRWIPVVAEEDMAREAHTWLLQAVSDRLAHANTRAPRITIPAGRTPLQLYARLVADPETAALLRQCEFFPLDEYVTANPSPVGLEMKTDADAPSFLSWLWRIFYGPIGVNPARIHPLPATAGDEDTLEHASARYESALRAAGGLDIAVLGIGSNGHVGFNEPGTPLDCPTHVGILSEETIRANEEYWRVGGIAPDLGQRGVTLGLGTLRAARRILLLVPHARIAIAEMAFREPPTPTVPASALQFADDVTVIAVKDEPRLP